MHYMPNCNLDTALFTCEVPLRLLGGCGHSELRVLVIYHCRLVADVTHLEGGGGVAFV